MKELQRYSKGKEPYDKVIRRLLRQAKRSSFYERQKRILRTEKFIPLKNV